MAAAQARNPTTRRAVIALWLLLAACLLCSCRSIQTPDPLVSGGGLLDGLHRATLRDPAVTWVDQYELQDEKIALRTWMQQRMGREFRSLDSSYLLTSPKAIAWEAVEANANRYMDSTLGASPIQLAPAEGDAYRMLVWKPQHKDYHVALVMTRDPLPGQDGRRLAAYYVMRDASLPLPADVLVAMQRWATPTPPDRLLPAHEHAEDKAAMRRWLERYLDHNYRIVRQRFVLTEPGFTQSAAIVSKANQYVEWALGGVQQDFRTWPGDEQYHIIAWNVGSGHNPQLIVFIETNDFLPDTDERTLIGYFHISSLHQN